MNTLLLDQTLWDLVADARGNIAMASDPYSQAQDVASACRLFAGELWYDTTKGVRWFDVLGELLSVSFVQAQCNAAALTVPEVAEAQTVITGVIDGVLGGQVEFSDEEGTLMYANFSFSTGQVPSFPRPEGNAVLGEFILDVSRLA